GRRLLHLAQLVFGIRIVRVDEHRDGRGLGNHFVQQSQPLRLEPRSEMIDSGDVSAWPIEAGDEAQPDGIAAGGEHNGNCHIAALTANTPGAPPPETIPLTCRRTRSAASASSRSYCPSAQRYSTATFWPSIKPDSFRPSWNAAICWRNGPGDAALR